MRTIPRTGVTTAGSVSRQAKHTGPRHTGLWVDMCKFSNDALLEAGQPFTTVKEHFTEVYPYGIVKGRIVDTYHRYSVAYCTYGQPHLSGLRAGYTYGAGETWIVGRYV